MYKSQFLKIDPYDWIKYPGSHILQRTILQIIFSKENGIDTFRACVCLQFYSMHACVFPREWCISMHARVVPGERGSVWSRGASGAGRRGVSVEHLQSGGAGPKHTQQWRAAAARHRHHDQQRPHGQTSAESRGQRESPLWVHTPCDQTHAARVPLYES